ncbi:hypothetical protein PVAND_012701 [Polypedilum vanderplanki]|uniref:Uncharacterized protein n=1 Tax=Polypedilum vanderplanki TaxID=319348 RepID=A0A9J6CMA8_POLVA|nr:hypothetical protein PVAND_012701 [Polypedilum vanderplanki]
MPADSLDLKKINCHGRPYTVFSLNFGERCSILSFLQKLRVLVDNGSLFNYMDSFEQQNTINSNNKNSSNLQLMIQKVLRQKMKNEITIIVTQSITN